MKCLPSTLVSRLWCLLAVAAGLAGLGCESSSPQRDEPRGFRPASQPSAQPVPVAGTNPLRNRENETSSQVLAYPTGDRASSVILLEKKFPTQARLGQIYKYQIQVTNLKDWPVSGVVVREDFPSSFAVVKDPAAVTPGSTLPATVDLPVGALALATRPSADEQPSDDSNDAPPPAVVPVPGSAATTAPSAPLATPMPVRDGSDVRYVQNIGYVRDVAGTWWGTATRRERRGIIAQEYLVGTLEPGEVRQITVAGVSDELGKLDTRSTVTYTPVLAGGTDVINPILKLTRDAPRHADLCDPIELRYVIANVGVGTETEVRIDEALPEGLLTEDGKSAVRINVGELPQDQSKTFTVKVRAARTGEYKTQAQAKGFGTATQSIETLTAVHAPKLTVAVTGPEAEYVGKAATYEVTISNIGDASARNTVLSVTADAGATVQYGAGGAATQPASGGGFAVGTIEPGASRKMQVSVRPALGGVMVVKPTARADCADAAGASTQTTVKTIAALAMQVTDNEVPVRIGEAATYRITLKNGGSGPDRNIKVVATLPPQLKLVQTTGPTPGTAEGSKVAFAPLNKLDAGQSVSWLVEVRAEEAGDVRFRVEMTSESLSEPVIETQSTRLY